MLARGGGRSCLIKIGKVFFLSFYLFIFFSFFLLLFWLILYFGTLSFNFLALSFRRSDLNPNLTYWNTDSNFKLLREALWHIGMSSVSGSEGPWFKLWLRLKIYWIRNDTGSLIFKIYTILFLYIHDWWSSLMGVR